MGEWMDDFYQYLIDWTDTRSTYAVSLITLINVIMIIISPMLTG